MKFKLPVITLSKNSKNLTTILMMASLSLLPLLVSCDHDKNLFRIDIANSVSLFIVPADSVFSSRLFKITDDDIVEEVSFLNKKGHQINETFIPEMVLAISNSDYFAASIRNQYNKATTYLVRKSDGTIFDMNIYIEVSGHNQVGGYRNSDYFAQDENKNIFFKNYKQLFMLNTSNLNSITSIPLTTNSETIFFGFTISAKGDIFYNTEGVYKIRRSAGGLVNVPYIKLSTNSWTGLDGKIKYIVDGMNDLKYDTKKDDYTYLYPVRVLTVDIDANNVASFTVEKTINTAGGWYHGAALLLRFANRIILIPSSFHGASNFLEVDNFTNTLREIVLSYGLSSVNRGVNSENYYYLSGLNSSKQPFLIKIDPSSDTVTELFPAGAYQVYEMAVCNNDHLTINALRIADGVKIIGKISPSGVLAVIDEQMNVEVTVLKNIQ